MNLVLKFGDRIRKLSQPLLLELEQLVASWRGWIAVEHQADGTHGAVTATSFTGPLTGAVTGNVTGNASTATALQTARAINGVNFDGTAAITVTADANTLTGTTLKSTVVTSSLTSLGTLSAVTVGGTATINKATNGTGLGFYLQCLTRAAGERVFEISGNASGKEVIVTTDGWMGFGVDPSTRLDLDAGAMEFVEMTAPSAGAANTARLFCQDNGAGKSQLCVRFNTGAIQVLATEP